MVPDPFDRDASYARHHEVDVESILPAVGIFPEFLYQAERYRSGMYAEGMKTALANKEKIKENLNHYRDAEHKIPDSEVYWPISVFCEKCNKDTTTIEGWDGEVGRDVLLRVRQPRDGRSPAGEGRQAWLACRLADALAARRRSCSSPRARITIRRAVRSTRRVSSRRTFTAGTRPSRSATISSASRARRARCRRRRVRSSTFTMCSACISRKSSAICSRARGRIPSSSSVSISTLSRFTKTTDKTERIAWGVEKAKNDETFAKERRIYELSQVADMPACVSYQVPFLPSLQSVADQRRRYRRGNRLASRRKARAARSPFRPARAVPGTGSPSARPRISASRSGRTARRPVSPAPNSEAVKKIRDEVLPKMDGVDEKALSELTYAVATECGIEPKALFTATYQALIGKDQGPRLASFMKIIGRDQARENFVGILKTETGIACLCDSRLDCGDFADRKQGAVFKSDRIFFTGVCNA